MVCNLSKHLFTSDVLSLSTCALIDTVSTAYGNNNNNTTGTTTGTSGGVAGTGVGGGDSVVHEVSGCILSLVLEDREVGLFYTVYKY